MIIIRVELLSAITGKTQELARMHIINDGTGTNTKGNYTCVSFRGRTKEALDKATAQKAGKINDWPRLELHVWNLVSKALRTMGYNKD